MEIYRSAVLGNYASGALSKLKLLCLVACQSGVTESGYKGNLVDMALNKAALCVIGWNESMYGGDAQLWEDVFFDWISTGYNVGTAIDESVIEMYDVAREFETISALYLGGSPIYSLTLA